MPSGGAFTYNGASDQSLETSANYDIGAICVAKTVFKTGLAQRKMPIAGNKLLLKRSLHEGSSHDEGSRKKVRLWCNQVIATTQLLQDSMRPFAWEKECILFVTFCN